MSEIRLENAVKIYKRGRKKAVDEISFTCHDKEFLAILGPSGAGKTSTLKLIAGSEEFTSGKLYINGKDMTDEPSQKRNVSMVFEGYALYPHKTVAGNLSFPLEAPIRKAKYSKDDLRKQVEEVAEIVGLENLLDRKPNELSGGQRQRVSLARALIRGSEPNVILMDEPIAHLDAKLRNNMRAELKKLHQELGATIIYVTHDYVEAMAMADHIIVINNGRVIQEGIPKEIYDNPKNEFVALTCGDPPINLIPGSVKDGTFYFGDMKIPVSRTIGNSDIDYGIRPADLAIRKEKKEEPCFVGRLENILPTGAKQIMEVNVNNRMVLAKCQRDLSYKKGEIVYLYPSEDKASLFDQKTKENLNRKE